MKPTYSTPAVTIPAYQAEPFIDDVVRRTRAMADDVLVVDTVGFLPRALNPRAEVMISGQTHILERFEYDEAERALLRRYTVTDPLYLEKPYSGVNVSDIAAQQYQPFQCVDLSGENNRRPDE